jgi:hypothetical protein
VVVVGDRGRVTEGEREVEGYMWIYVCWGASVWGWANRVGSVVTDDGTNEEVCGGVWWCGWRWEGFVMDLDSRKTIGIWLWRGDVEG